MESVGFFSRVFKYFLTPAERSGAMRRIGLAGFRFAAGFPFSKPKAFRKARASRGCIQKPGRPAYSGIDTLCELSEEMTD
jgi:hypothetical protein